MFDLVSCRPLGMVVWSLSSLSASAAWSYIASSNASAAPASATASPAGAMSMWIGNGCARAAPSSSRASRGGSAGGPPVVGVVVESICTRARGARRIVRAQQQAAQSEEPRKLKDQRRVQRLRARKVCRAVGKWRSRRARAGASTLCGSRMHAKRRRPRSGSSGSHLTLRQRFAREPDPFRSFARRCETFSARSTRRDHAHKQHTRIIQRFT